MTRQSNFVYNIKSLAEYSIIQGLCSYKEAVIRLSESHRVGEEDRIHVSANELVLLELR